MKQGIWERFIWWLCDTFGHKKTDSRNGNIEWYRAGMYHYTCLRCRRIVSRAAAQESAGQDSAQVAGKDGA